MSTKKPEDLTGVDKKIKDYGNYVEEIIVIN